jgi:hypothetical protein
MFFRPADLRISERDAVPPRHLDLRDHCLFCAGPSGWNIEREPNGFGQMNRRPSRRV